MTATPWPSYHLSIALASPSLTTPCGHIEEATARAAENPATPLGFPTMWQHIPELTPHQCNEAKPTCQRCTKTGHACEYRDMTLVMFRYETTAVEKKAQEKWRARAKPKNLTDGFSDYLIKMKTPGFAMPVDLIDCARNRFFFDYPLPSDDPLNLQKAVLDYLPGLYAQACPGSPLPAAVNSVCLINFYPRAGPSSNKALLLASKAYGEALAGVQLATRDQAQAASDSVVMAVHLLGIYEVSSLLL
jgi:hypothetical protein